MNDGQLDHVGNRFDVERDSRTKLPSQCQPVSLGSGRFGNLIGKVPKPNGSTLRPWPTS